MKSKRSKAMDVSHKTRLEVFERENYRCLLCGDIGTDCAHYLSRGAKGGLGIPENLVLLCRKCHFELDQTPKRKELLLIIKHYLELKYPGFQDKDRVYNKWKK